MQLKKLNRNKPVTGRKIINTSTDTSLPEIQAYSAVSVDFFMENELLNSFNNYIFGLKYKNNDIFSTINVDILRDVFNSGFISGVDLFQDLVDLSTNQLRKNCGLK